MPQRYRSWGMVPRAGSQSHAVRVTRRGAPLPVPRDREQTCLPFGNGRSYGDVCLNDGGMLLDARGLDRFISFDREAGLLRCEAGVLLGEILSLVMPHGFVLPTTPGTQFVTVGGAIANDVHGKNHHRAGSFGCHVRALELARSDGTRLRCSTSENPQWFAATIGGLGLTGLIVWAEIALQRVASPAFEVDTVPCPDLSSLIECSRRSEADYEHTVGWLDCLARGARLGRGFVMRANHASTPARAHFERAAKPLGMPFTPPLSLVNGATLKALNSLYFHAVRWRSKRRTMAYDEFCYPLDGIRNWNRMYGPHGFVQYQCAVPHAGAEHTLAEMLEKIARARTGSVLAVLKTLGTRPSPGLLAFARPGVTLALDLPNRGAATLALLDALDRIVLNAGGALYPAKDARMSAQAFKRFYPRWSEMRTYCDARFSSSFWRRVTAE
ncbi:MAG: FAD-binding oxidoreductase [Gammaproteobacteria bacterium]